MKKISAFEDSVFDSSELMKRAGKTLFENMGKVIAFTVALLMLLVTFTDVSFAATMSESFVSSLLLLITSSYVIYFSLEDAGEKCAEETEEYKSAKERYSRTREKIRGEDIENLRGFCLDYSERELTFRKKNALIKEGLSEEQLNDYLGGKEFDRQTARKLKRINSVKPAELTPRLLLSEENYHRRSELESPQKRKLVYLIVKLIPSTVCMTVTLSVMLSAKDGLTAADVINGILKLSALPMIGFKGYSAGYSYSKHSLSSWMMRKADILESFLLEKS